MFPVCPLCCFIVIPMDLVSEINDDDDDDKLSLLTWKALHTAEPTYLSELISPYVTARIY